MTYQGERARPMASETGRFFEVSKVRIGPDDLISEVLWSEVQAGSNRNTGARVLALAAEVVDAIHDGATVFAVFPSASGAKPERDFLVVEQQDGVECIAFSDGTSPGRNLSDMERLDE